MSLPSRGDMLADLADAINELTEIRNHTELIEAEERDGLIRRRVRRKRIVTFPSLLDELAEAMKPGAAGEASAAGFESRPAAELEPINVMAMITEQSRVWANLLNVERSTLKGLLHGLVGAQHSDIQLASVLKDAAYWVKRARQATGWDESPMTLNLPCPYCWKRHTLVITSDLMKAKCKNPKCNAEWDEMTIGLLGQMLTSNAEVETMPQARCDSLLADLRCYRLETHIYEHVDHRGRWWYSTPEGEPFTEVSA